MPFIPSAAQINQIATSDLVAVPSADVSVSGTTVSLTVGQVHVEADVRDESQLPLESVEVRLMAAPSTRHIEVLLPTGAAASNIKTVDGLARASVKTINGLALASVKTRNGLQ